MADLLRWARPKPGASAYQEKSETEILSAVKAATAHPWFMRHRRCLREGLLAFHFLSLAGYAPVLHFGIMTASVGTHRPRGHCWVTLNGKTVLNPPEAPMLVMFTFDGRVTPSKQQHADSPTIEYA